MLQQSGLKYVNTPRATDAELVTAFQQCDLVAFVSTYEGFGLPIIEANATGRPVSMGWPPSMPSRAANLCSRWARSMSSGLKAMVIYAVGMAGGLLIDRIDKIERLVGEVALVGVRLDPNGKKLGPKVPALALSRLMWAGSLGSVDPMS